MRAIIAKNNLSYIGLNNKLPWKCSEDLKHFKKMTIDQALIVGPNTLSTLPFLKQREIIIANYEYLDYYKSDEAKIWKGFTYTQDGKMSIYHDRTKDTWCIGGKKTYEMLCPWFTELHISHINDNTIGDTMFPDFSNLNKECKIFNYYFDV